MSGSPPFSSPGCASGAWGDWCFQFSSSCYLSFSFWCFRGGSVFCRCPPLYFVFCSGRRCSGLFRATLWFFGLFSGDLFLRSSPGVSVSSSLLLLQFIFLLFSFPFFFLFLFLFFLVVGVFTCLCESWHQLRSSLRYFSF